MAGFVSRVTISTLRIVRTSANPARDRKDKKHRGARSRLR